MQFLAFWREGLIGALLIALAIALGVARHNDARADKWQQRAFEEAAAHKQTVANYRQAAELARAQDAANKARVEAEQERITRAISSDYSKRLADLRAHYERLRTGATGADPGAPGGQTVPRPPGAPSGTSGDGGSALVSSSDQLICGINTIKAEAWLDWYERVKKVER